MKKSKLPVFLFLLCCISLANAADEIPGPAPVKKDQQLNDKPLVQIFGWAEFVMLDRGRQWKLNAKLDTGADTSSLDARNVRRVRVNEKKYVRFEVTDPQTGESISLRRPYVRTVRIREHSGEHQRRRVVLMNICLGNQARTIEVTLADRKAFSFPMLLGRSALSGLAIVDPAREWTRDPDCWDKAEIESNQKKLSPQGIQ